MNKYVCRWDEFLQKYRPFVDSRVPSHLRHHQGGDRKMKKSEIGTCIWNSFVNPYTRSWKYPILLAWEPQLVRSLPWSTAGGRFVIGVLNTRLPLFSKHKRLKKLAWYKEQEHCDFKFTSCAPHVDRKNEALIAWCGKILALHFPLIGKGSQNCNSNVFGSCGCPQTVSVATETMNILSYMTANWLSVTLG